MEILEFMIFLKLLKLFVKLERFLDFDNILEVNENY